MPQEKVVRMGTWASEGGLFKVTHKVSADLVILLSAAHWKKIISIIKVKYLAS